MNILIQNAYNDAQRNELKALYKPYYYKGYVIDITGDACINDEIVYVEPVLINNQFSHFTVIEGRIIYDSYNDENKKHIFTILTLEKTLVRYAATVYKYLTLSRLRDLKERQAQLDEKHNRGKFERETKNKKDISNTGKRYDTTNLYNQIIMPIFTH